MILIQRYEEILSGKRKMFPNGTWSEDGRNNFKVLIRYLILEKLKLTRNEFCKTDTWRLLKKYKLYGGLVNVFKCKLHDAVMISFPEWNLKEWEYGLEVPRSFWNDETIILATKWLIEDKLKWSKEDITKNISEETFKIYKLTTLFVMKGGIYELMNLVYPNENWNYLKDRAWINVSGSNSKVRKLEESDISYILTVYKQKSVREIAKEVNVSVSSIYNIIKGKQWKHLHDSRKHVCGRFNQIEIMQKEIEELNKTNI